MKNYKLVEARETAGYSQKTFSKLIPMSSYSYYLKENGKRQFKVSEANKICKLLNKTYDELFK